MANDLTQAEIAGRIFKTAEERPVKGELLRDFELTSTKGRKISISDYRGRANLVLVFADASTGSGLLVWDCERLQQNSRGTSGDIGSPAGTNRKSGSDQRPSEGKVPGPR